MSKKGISNAKSNNVPPVVLWEIIFPLLLPMLVRGSAKCRRAMTGYTEGMGARIKGNVWFDLTTLA